MPSLLSRCGGGGSITPQQGQYNSALTPITSGGGFGDASWLYVAGDAVLDLTNPALPLAAATGLYLISATYGVSGGGTAGRPFRGGLSINSSPPVVVSQDLTNPAGGFGIEGFVSAAVKLTAGTFIRFPFFNQDTANHNFNIVEAFVVFIPTS